MKKIISLIAVLVFAFTFGLAYAAERTPAGMKGGKELYNGATDFTGRSYDTFEIAPAGTVENGVYESSAAGSKRIVEKVYNGITNFSGRSYDTFEINPEASDSQGAEGSATGSLRKDLSGKASSTMSYDTLPMNPALGW